jgi:hypothetical protein
MTSVCFAGGNGAMGMNSKSHAVQEANDNRLKLLTPFLQQLQQGIDNHLQKLSTSFVDRVSDASTIEQEQEALAALFATVGNNRIRSYCQSIYDHMMSAIDSTSKEDEQRALLKNGWKQIGQAVFLVENIPQEVNALIDDGDQTKTKWAMALRSSQEVQKMAAGCKHIEAQVKKTAFQDPELCLSFVQAQTIAKILLTSKGILNLGMISTIKDAFTTTKSPYGYEIGMDRVLSSMTAAWQPVLDTIVKPIAGNQASVDVIRSDLGLSQHTAISDNHAKWAALKAILSPVNQGAVGDCFAVAWTIKKHNEYMLQSLQDYAELLQYGYLTRTVNGKPDQFFFKTSLADTDLTKTVIIGSQGEWGNTGLKFSDVPSIAAACSMMGIDDPRGVHKAVVRLLFKRKSKTLATTPEEIISAFAAYSVQNTPGLNLTQQISRGKYGFSITQNHLLRAWETSLAAMAEAAKGAYLRDLVISAVDAGLQQCWSVLHSSLSREQKEIADELKSTFEETLNTQNRFIYNAAIPLKQIARDGTSTSGGFELYKRNMSKPLAMGDRIATPDNFRDYLIEVLKRSVAAMQPEAMNSNQADFLHQMAANLLSSLQQRDFLKYTFYACDQENQNHRDPVADYQSLTITPMTALVGNNPYAVEAIDTGLDFMADMKTIQAKTPYDLVKWILDIAAWKEKTQRYLEDSIPDELDSATSPQHAFNIIFEEEDIASFVKSGKTSDQWLGQLMKDNQPIAEAILDDECKTRFVNEIVQWLENNAGLSSLSSSLLKTSLVLLNLKTMTISEYATSAYKKVLSAVHADSSIEHQIAPIFDTLFLYSLPEETLTALSQSALRFANTNWNSGEKNLYFCVFFNPRTSQLGFGTIAEDRTELQEMSEYEWIDNLTWEVVPVNLPAATR